MEQRKQQFHSEEHVLVCLSSAPSNAKIIRTAAKMARAFHSQFTALFVETPDFSVASAENKRRLQKNRVLAEELGAKVEVVFGDDVAYQIAAYARVCGATKIVLGRSAVTRKTLFRKPTLTEQLMAYAPEIDIHIIPDQSAETAYYPRKNKAVKRHKVWLNILESAGILAGATVLGLTFRHLGFTEANIIMVYLLGVLLTSIVTSHQIYSLVSAMASVFVFNYLFTTPRFSLMAYGTGYPVTFVIMFLTAYITGTFAIRYKEQAGQSARVAYRTQILLDTAQILSKAKTREEILAVASGQVAKLLRRNVVVLEVGEKSASEEHWLCFPLKVNDRVYGTVGVEAQKEPLDAFEHSVLLSILGECALALENEKNAREKEAAAILAENEQLRANLLRTISHDLRTPLTTISGNADNLLIHSDCLDEETKKQLYADIYEDSMWLINLVENLLYATRIEDGRMTLQTSAEVLGDIVEEAVRYAGRNVTTHRICVHEEEDLLLVRVDAKLIVQVMVNIIDNAVKYTPAGTEILISTEAQDDMVQICIADTGEGIPDEEKEKVFEKFYCGANPVADGRRSLGLGLYLCKAIVEAHGGSIWVEDNEPRGAVFEFTLPREEVGLYE